VVKDGKIYIVQTRPQMWLKFVLLQTEAHPIYGVAQLRLMYF
jgi:hypothetical protein